MSKTHPKLILASRSPLRRELLSAAGYSFEVRTPCETSESGLHGDLSAAELVARLAYQKAADVAARVEDGLILACDTVAECDGQIFGKPTDVHHARTMLDTLRGRRHRVFSGLCLWKVPDGKPDCRVATTTLLMDPISDELLDDYLADGGWYGKAGAFGYQDRIGWIHIIEGSESNVVGLPMELLAEMLAAGSDHVL